MSDIRTPSYYFEERNRKRQQINDIKVKLDDLLIHLQGLKNKEGSTPAYKTIVDNEINRVKKKRIQQGRRKQAKSIVDKIIDNDGSDAVEMMKEELDLRAYSKIQPDIQKAGSEIENELFYSE